MFVNSFHLMVALARAPNKFQEMSESRIHGSGFQSYLQLRVLRRLSVNDAIRGLYQTAFKLGSLHPGEFYRTLVGLFMRDIPVGIIDYRVSAT